MSKHYIYLVCSDCDISNSIYTGNIDPEDFTNGEWEGEHISTTCDSCLKKGVDDE